MIRRSTAVAARQNFGDLLNQVQYRSDSVLITKDGKPVAALVDVEMFERIRRMRDDFAVAHARKTTKAARSRKRR